MAAQDKKHRIAVPEFDVLRDGRETETAFMELSVGKVNGGVGITTKIVGLHEGFVTFKVYGDFFKRELVKESKRVTQKAIDTVYGEVVTDAKIEELKGAAIAFYAERFNTKMVNEGYIMTPEQKEFFASRTRHGS